MAIEGIFYVHAHVSDLARAKRFYGETLGWKLHTDEPGARGASATSASPIPTATCGSTGRQAPESAAVQVRGPPQRQATSEERSLLSVLSAGFP